MNNQMKGNVILFITALIWGISFVSQSVGMEYVGPNTFMGIRTVMGGLVLLPFICVSDLRRKRQGVHKKTDFKKLLKYGAICGVFLCAASTLQTYGLKYTTTAKSGFLTALYIFFVAMFGLFFGKRLNAKIILGIVSAVLGMYFLCIFGQEVSVNKGDALTVICAVFFAGQILFIDKFVHEVDGVKLSCVQFLISGLMNFVLMLLLEKPDIRSIMSCATPLLYSGIMSCGVAYTLQVVGQKYSEPTSASIIMSFESVFAALSGWIILSETMKMTQVIGCVLMFLAIILVQLPDKMANKKTS